MTPLNRQKLKRWIYRVAGPDGFDALNSLRGRKEAFSEIREIFHAFRASGVRRGFMVDVGTHWGSSLAPFLWLGWRVLGFEPDPKNRAIVAGAWGHPRLTIVPMAVAAKAGGELPFYQSPESSGVSGLSAFLPSHVEVARVRITSLAEQLDARWPEQVDFLKIDTEGHDWFVLQGFPWKTRPKPSVVLAEFEDRKTLPLGYSFRDLAGFLHELGYDVWLSELYPLERYGGEARWRGLRRFPCELADARAAGNVIALDTASPAGTRLHSVLESRAGKAA